MIIKGSSRGNPKQLTRHLLRTDTNELVKVLELQNPSGNLQEAFTDWQLLSGLTKGKKGLYHANIDPDARFPMTPDQWPRAADVLEEELGLKGQPRAIILHEKNGRQHIHVVWQRTDTENETLISDGHNYRAHERASLRLEQEFGHEIVPGAFAKRDPEKSRLREAFNHSEWQQAERTGEDPRDRKAVITEIFKSADTGAAFQAALQDQGYALAQGDRRAFVIVDSHGEVYSLARNVEGTKTKEIKERLSDIELSTLPTVEAVRAFQNADRERLEKAVAELFQPQATQLPTEPQNAQEAPQGSKLGPSSPVTPEELKGIREEFSEQAKKEEDLSSIFQKAGSRLDQIQTRFDGLARELAERHAEELTAHLDRSSQALADQLGVDRKDLTRAVLSLEGSRFSDLQLPDMETRKVSLNLFKEQAGQELKEIHDTQASERAALESQKREALEEEQARIEQLEKLEAQVRAQREKRRTRGQDLSRDDDDDLLQ